MGKGKMKTFKAIPTQENGIDKSTIYEIPQTTQNHAWINSQKYKELYTWSLEDPLSFWKKQGQCIDWITPYTQVSDCSFDPHDVHIRWYADGTLNACANCLDRHLETKQDQVAIHWQGDNPEDKRSLTYGDLFLEVCKISNGLKELGVKKGDCVALYLPMIPEALVAMLACARLGAIHSVVFGGFSSEALAKRILDCEAKLVITADEGFRRGQLISFKQNTDKALEDHDITSVEHVVVVKRSGNPIPWQENRDQYYHDLTQNACEECPVEIMNAEDPLFILYTSGSTGTPKGVLHTTGGYMVYGALTFKYIFDYKEKDVYWCTADFGWITGHTYGVYGPLANGATLLMFEGVPDYPDVSRYWKLIEEYKVNIFYTAPTAIRALMRHGSEAVLPYNRSSLRLLGTVGEPIDPTAWEWYYHIVGEGQCPIVDTWWQTETGGILLSPLPGATPLKPGSVALPFFGINAGLVDKNCQKIEGPTEGDLVLLTSWPGQMRTVYRDHERFVQTYFTQCPGTFYTGDGARRDEDGYYWITGRTDDVIKVSGHRLGTANIESVMDAHPQVAETAAVGFPHEIKGQGIYLFIILEKEEVPSEDLRQNLRAWARQKIGPIATPDFIQWAEGLPKTRSGKVMRRILRHIAENKINSIGDTSTLAEPAVVEDLIRTRLNQ